MTEIEELRRLMDEASADLRFEEASRLRDRISLLRGQQPGEAAAEIDISGLDRQQPGRMGLGTSQQRVVPPAGWTPPAKPDPMTKGRSRSRNRPARGG
jgi:hypothetical protein